MIDKNELVITADGSSAPRGNCRYIKGEFHIVGDPKIEGSGQCYELGGRYYRDSTGYIVYNHTEGTYTTNKEPLTQGVVGLKKDSSLKLGYFVKTNQVSILTEAGNTYLVFNEKSLEGNKKYKYLRSHDMYVAINATRATDFLRYKNVDPSYKRSLNYDCREIIPEYTKAYDKNNLKIGSRIAKNAPLLKGLSFGLEFETVKGMVPSRITGPLGLIPLRDGSVSGLEYATIPYSGEKGLQATLESCKALEKHTAYNNDCSLHLHIGNIPRTESFFLAFFKVMSLLQDEIYEMFPLYKKYNFGIKRQNYTKALPANRILTQLDKVITSTNVTENFSVLYKFLSAGQDYSTVGSDIDNVSHHPSDPGGRSKWNIKSRYYHVNLIPLLFGNKKTVEFRIHTPTTDPDKVLNYIFMCAAIVNFVKENEDTILDSTKTNSLYLGDVVSSGLGADGHEISDVLYDYIGHRKHRTHRENKMGNMKGNEEDISGGYFKWELTKSDKKSKPTRTSRRTRRGDAGEILDELLGEVPTTEPIAIPRGINIGV